jgi:two-component system, sensor histidine kinase PdtaS
VERLRKTEETYNVAMEHTRQIIYDYDLRTNKCVWVGAIEEVTGYSFGEFQRLGKDAWIENIIQTDINRFDRGCCDKEATEFKEEFNLRKKDGTFVYVENRGICLKNHEGHLYRTVGILKDITTQKETEATLTKINILRKQEIHHRIKNNLQVISSLLDLQADKFSNRECIKDSEVLEAFRESQNRVMSMTLIHEELYKDKAFKGEGIESVGFETLNFSPYIEKLAENLFQTYVLGNTNISLNIELEDNLFFNMDTAIPLGIIVNELVSNSLKHAFKGIDRGEIRIKLHIEKGESDNSTSFILIVSDNGVGIPENLEIEDLDSLGMQLVITLVDQLDGELELKRNNGTEFTMRFTVTEKANQTSASALQELIE